MAKTTVLKPIYAPTDFERQRMQELAMQAPSVDPYIAELMDGPGGGIRLGAQGALATSILERGMMAVERAFSPTTTPLNLTLSKSQADPLKDDMSVFMRNNPESIAEDLNQIPSDEHPWILSAPDFETYQQRVEYVKRGENKELGSTAGYALGMTADMGLLTTMGLVAEPLALAGLGTRTTMAGRVGAQVLGREGTKTLATAAAEAATTVSRLNLGGRYLTLGVAEEAVYQATKQGIDPLYDPTFGEAMFDFVLSGSLAGGLGGVAFGRTFVKENIEAAVKDFKAARTVDLPGGYKVTYSSWGFDSPAAADKMLFAPGTGNLAFEADRVAGDLWADWSRTGTFGTTTFDPVIDLSIPGTRSMSLPVLQEGVPAAPVARAAATPEVQPPTPEIRDAAGRIPAKPKVGPLVGLRSAIKAAAFELSLAGAKLDRELFAKIGEVLVRIDQQKLRAGGFNKAFWDELLSTVDPEVAARVRRVSERAFIPGIDKSVLDVARREDMVTSVWDAFRQRQHLEPNAPKSLIFEVLQEIRNRGGKVDRAMVSNVIDELRKISQTPPKRLNRKGVMTLDVTGRRAQVIEIINKRVTDNRQIFIDPSLIKRMSSDVAAKVETPAVAMVNMETKGTAADASDVPVNRVRIPFWDRIGNQSALVHQSKNGWARLIGNYAFFARRDMGEAQAHTIFEWGTQKLYAASAMFTKGYRNGFIRFALGGGTQNVSQNVTLTDQFVTMLRQRKMRAEFDARVVKQLRTGAYDDAVDAVNDTAKGIREMFNKVFDLAHSAGLNGFQKSARVNYMPRMWRWDRIRRLATTPKGRASLESLVKQAIDQDGRRVVIDGVEEVFTEDIDAAAKVFTNRLISIAQGEEAAPMIQQEQDLFQAILDLEGPLKAKTGSRTPYGRASIMLNETVVMQDPDDSLALGKDVLGLADLMHDDLPYVFRTYVTSVMGAINERRMIDAFNAELKARGILSPAFMSKNGLTQKDITVQTVGEMVALAKKLGGGIESQHEEGIKELMAAIRYEPIHHGRTRVTDRILPVLQSFGYLTTGGQFGLAALSEVSRIVSTVGLGNTLRQMPILAEMVTNWKNLDSDGKNFASAIDAWFSPSTDRLRRSLSDQWDALRDTSSTSRFEKGLQRTANFMSDISLLSPVTSFSQHLTAAATLQHLVEAAKGGRRLDDSLVRTLGLTPERYQNLIDWVGRNAITEKRFMGERVVDLKNIDAKEMVELAQFVDRMVRTRIQDIPTRGDFAKGMFSFLGKLLTQFRTFNLKGVDNFLLQNISRSVNGGSPQVMAEIASTMVFAGTIQYLRNYADWKSYESVNNYEKMDEIEKNLDIAGFIRGAAAGPSEFFVPALLTDTVWTRFVDKDPIFSPYRYSGLSMYGFPAQAMLSRADSVFGDFYGASVGKALGLDVERETTRGTIHRARLLLPFQNMFGLKQYFNIAETQIADWLRAPEQQPRRIRD